MSKYAPGIEHMGWTAIYIVDEHGCLLHTEPVCTVPTGSKINHAWFVEWLKKQECPYVGVELLYHPMLHPLPPQEPPHDGE